ncbi:MAG: TonB-dependent receptor [Zunongwangia sp.]|uniref:SusC/RagA family TonB-linked outer membrane protein n=1 Tax=Zunongwangia sp. TaxID=1965325 RepID=UPI0032428CF7
MKKTLHGLLTLFMVLVVQLSFAQEKTITGTVVDEDGLPLPGVNVIEKGTRNGVQTDFDGEYSISVPQSATLVFSYVGFATQQQVVGSGNTINITMALDAAALDEVVVTAYGTQTRESITGSIAEVSSEELAETQSGNVVQGLTGKVAGVQIINNTGQPGAAPVVRFRGIGSINASSEPLYVVDGVPFLGDVNTINNQDIASISFLKDASAAALYGSRGANGVVIITTKQGGNKPFTVTLDARVGFNSRAVKDYDIMSNPGEYYEGYYQAYRNNLIHNQGLSPDAASQYAAANLITETNDFGLGLGSPNLNYNVYSVGNGQVIDPSTGRLNSSANLRYAEDWDDYLFDNQIARQETVSVSGGGENSSIYFSLGHDKNDGYVVNSGFEKYTGRLNAEANIVEVLKIGGSVNYARTTQKTVGGDGTSAYSNPLSWARNIAPIYPVFAYDENNQRVLDNGELAYDDGTGAYGMPVRPYGGLQNPVATAKLDIINNVNDNVFGTAFVKWDITDGLNFTYNIAADVRNRALTNFDTPLYGDAKGVNGRGTNTTSNALNFTQQQLLNYEKVFGKHDVSILLGHETTNYEFKYMSLHKTNFLLPDVPYLDLAAAYQSSSNYMREYGIEGYFSRLNYSYDRRYYINASFRRDASSVFHPDNQWGNFYGVGGAWRLSQEKFLKNVSWLNELKLKASYGEQGNDQILYPGSSTRNYYAYRDQFEVLPNDGEIAIQLTYLGNPDLSWETNANFNAGFEFAAFENRFTINAEYFSRSVKDMLFNTPLAPSSGNPSFPENVGDMSNRGVEVTLTGELIRSNDFSLGLNINATHYKNEITRLPQESIVSSQFRYVEGGSVYDYYVRDYAGVNSENGNAQWYKAVLNENGDATNVRGEITEDFSEASFFQFDESPIPDLYGGFGLNLGYKGFDFGIDFAYQIGGTGYDSVYWNLFNASGDVGNNLHRDAVTKTWTVDNPNANLPRIDTESLNQYRGLSDLYFTDADYLSLQNISLGYTFSSDIVEVIGLKSLRIYALANNVHLWSKRQGYDPRLSLTGASSNEYSILRTVSGGVNIQF